MQQYTQFAQHHARLLYMVRVSLVLGFILVVIRLTAIPYGYWALITAVTILGAIPFVGGVISKANQRISGTIAGGLIGLSLFLIPPQYHWTHHIALFGLMIFAMYFTQEKYAYAALMSVITIVIVAGGGPTDFEAAGWRIINVFWAAVVSILASLFIFPARAKDQFVVLLEKFVSQCSEIYHHHNAEMAKHTFSPIHAEKLSEIIDKQTTLLPHAAREARALKPVFVAILAIQKRISADMETLVSTYWEQQQGKEKISDLEGLTAAKEELADCFEKLALEIPSRKIESIEPENLALMSLIPNHKSTESEDFSDISYFGYLWLNRELARQFAQLTAASKRLNTY
ncbi:FUSC family protein [Enterovibrio sp. NIFS-20-8]|nr:FUSC family protein [Enterovibrio paralichthyis]